MTSRHAAPGSLVARLLSCLLAAGAASACGLVVPAAEVPMPVVARQPLGPEHATGLLVLLPGAGDRAATFDQQGVLDSVAELAPRFDVVAADAHFGYYTAGVVQQRLELDVLGPARAQGYRQIWLLGVSLGGFGALTFAQEHPGLIDGVLLLGPYLGDGHLQASLLAAPSLAEWTGEDIEAGGEWHQRQLAVWRWLREQTGPDGSCEVFLAYGDRDGPGTLDERLAQALPDGRFAQRPGGHRWTVWKPLIRDLLPAMAAVAEQAAVTE